MARPESQALAGYFPTPSSLLASFASTLRWPEPLDQPVLLDPCAGEGEAIATLRERWAESYGAAPADEPWSRPFRPAIVACEVEAERARALRARLCEVHDAHHHADAFRLLASDRAGSGATVLYLNPPYDHDREYGRLEHRFLVRFTRHLAPRGILLFLVPFYALAASADFLATHYRDLRGWRLPEPHFDTFRQVLLLGRRAAQPLPPNLLRERIQGWAHDAERLPVLPERCPEPLAVETDESSPWGLSYTLEPLDLTAATEAFRPWQGTPTGVGSSARDLLGARFATAVPPKPAHIALALSTGQLNGHPIEPDDPELHPTLLAKGVFSREFVRVSERCDEDGVPTSAVEIELPRLRMTVLRLDTATFHTLREGTVPTGRPDLSEWNVADLIVHYTGSLTRLLARQFPPLHDPADLEGQISLPALARRPFGAQAQAVQAALKLLATGRNPFFVAEVGTGKSTMALYVAAALSPAHREGTLADLRHLGFVRDLPVVRRTLILCPPHLLSSWRDQVAAVLPEARVVIIESQADLDEPGEFFVLSRETAKLGHGVEGVARRCPRCGAPVATSPAANASRRLRCKAVTRTPANFAARLAVDLAAILAPALPENPIVGGLLRGRAAAHLSGEEPWQYSRDLLLGFLQRLEVEIAPLYEQSLRDDRGHTLRLQVTLTLFGKLARCLGTEGEAASSLKRHLDRDPGTKAAEYPTNLVRWQVQALESGGVAAGGGAAAMDEPARRSLLAEALAGLYDAALWKESAPCGEPLFQAVPRPRRYPLAKLILRRRRRLFDLVVLDEAHEFNHSESAQSKAAHRLAGLPGVPTIVLTGSLMGGYASSLFANFWALSPDFRREFGRGEVQTFVRRYGYLKTLVEIEDKPGTRQLGAHSDRELGQRQAIGEAPGVLPTFILRHLLPTAVLVHKDDLEAELPPLAEIPAEVGPCPGDDLSFQLLAEYLRMQRILLHRIGADRFVPGRAGRLLGALIELPSYLDRATDDLPPFEIRYPEDLGSELVATGWQFPAAWRTPKERWLLKQVAADLARGEKVLVFLRHTGSPELPQRLLRLLSELTPRVAWLDAKKVPTSRREAWIRQHVLDTGVEVLLVNPNAVRTGLNCLVAFSTAVWHQLDYSATTWRQANGRLHRIGQTRPVTIRLPYYPGTAQEVAMELVAKKISASLQVDGLDLEAALEAAGASPEHAASVASAMSFGQAVYEALTRGTAPLPGP